MGDAQTFLLLLVARPEGRRPFGRLGIGRRTILKWILNK
jgi:hypothetical protein